MREKSLNKGVVLIFGILFIGGFVFPVLFILAAIVAWGEFKAYTEPPIEICPDRPPPRLTVTAEDPDWRDPFLAYCESPAEEAFLQAAITAFGLVPEKGILKGSGLTLEMQVEKKPYRVDFLVDGWLVVEIDGAAYHSSPEAVARDAVRDGVLQSQGYTVLRIPAKAVFRNGPEAAHRIREAMTKKQLSVPTQLPAPSMSVSTAIQEMAKSMASQTQHGDADNLIKKWEDELRTLTVDIKVGVGFSFDEKYLVRNVRAFEANKFAITFAVNEAEKDIRIEDQISSSANLGQSLHAPQNLVRLGGNKKELFHNELFHRMLNPQPSGAYSRNGLMLHAERSKFILGICERLKVDPRLPDRVRLYLKEISCGNAWFGIARRLAPMTSEVLAGQSSNPAIQQVPFSTDSSDSLEDPA